MTPSKITKAVLEVANLPDPDGATTQPTDADPWTPNGARTPPLDLDQLASLTKISRLRRSCIRAIAHNTVGLGFDFGIRDGHEEDVSDLAEEARAARAYLDRLSRKDTMLRRPNFTKQITTVVWDKYEVGNGYLEVARNRVTGRVSGLFHAPGKRVRRRQDRDGWVVLTTAGGGMSDGVRYYDFGSKVAYDDDGQPTNKLADGASRWNVNELLPFQLYTSESRDYGLPPDAQLATDYLGDKLAGDTNVAFFGSSGVPPTVIFVQGEETEEGETVKIEVPPRFIEQVAGALRGGPPSGGRSRVAIIGVPAGFQAQVENLAVTSERDMGFIAYRADNRRATLGAFQISPVFVADIDDAGKYTAETERGITKEQVFDPEQQDSGETVDRLIAELFPHLQLNFRELAIKDDVARRESANDLADRGRITNKELRAAHGYDPLPEAEDGADPIPGQVPSGWNEELVVARSVPPRDGAPPSGETGRQELAKRSLADGIRDTWDEAVADAMDAVHELNPDAELRPMVVTKEAGGRIVVAPYSGNGTR